LHIANKTIMDSTKINVMATTFESEIDLGRLQRACPEIGHYFNFIEEKIRPVNPKWDKRVLNEYKNYYIRDGILWHIGKTQRRTQSIQE